MILNIDADAPADEGETPSAPGSWLGSLRGQIRVAPDADEAWAEMIRLMEEGPTFPDGSPDA